MSSTKWFDLKVNYISQVQQNLLQKKNDETPSVSSLPLADGVVKNFLSNFESILSDIGQKGYVQKLTLSDPIYSYYIDTARDGSFLSLEQIEQVHRAVANELKDHFKVVVNNELGGIVLRVYLIWCIFYKLFVMPHSSTINKSRANQSGHFIDKSFTCVLSWAFVCCLSLIWNLLQFWPQPGLSHYHQYWG